MYMRGIHQHKPCLRSIHNDYTVNVLGHLPILNAFFSTVSTGLSLCATTAPLFRISLNNSRFEYRALLRGRPALVTGVRRGASVGGRGGGGGGDGINGGDGFLDWRNDFIALDLLFKGSSEFSLGAVFLPKPKLNFFVFLDDKLKLLLGVFLLKGTASVGGKACLVDIVVGVDLVLGTVSLVRVVLTGLGADLLAADDGGCFLLGGFLMRSRTFFGGKTLVCVSL